MLWNVLTSVHDVIALSEKPCIVILMGNDELNPASKRSCLFPERAVVNEMLSSSCVYFYVFFDIKYLSELFCIPLCFEMSRWRF